MKKYLNNFLETKTILNLEQFGFRRGLNTFDALNTFNEEIYISLDSQNSLLSIYIDFTSKVFDTVLNSCNYISLCSRLYDYY